MIWHYESAELSRLNSFGWLGCMLASASSSSSWCYTGSLFFVLSRSSFDVRHIASYGEIVSEDGLSSSTWVSCRQLVWAVLTKQVMPKQRRTFKKSLEAGLSLWMFLELISSIFLLRSLLIFSSYLIYSFLRSLDFCADILFLFFFLVSCDSSSNTIEEAMLSSIFIS